MEMPGQGQWEPATDAVLAAMEAARLSRAGDEKEALATVMLAGDDLGVALAARRLLGDAWAGLDRLNGTVAA
jgi:hypothetical protein